MKKVLWRSFSYFLIPICLIGSGIYSLSQVEEGNETATLASPELMFDEDLWMPLQINPNNGEIRTWSGRILQENEINSEETKNLRLVSLWAIENPQAFWEQTELVMPPKDPNSDLHFDMTQPQIYAQNKLGKETEEERKAREVAELAIIDPITYQNSIGITPELGNQNESEK